MPRPKAFSGKQKKQQLQERRARNRVRDEAEEHQQRLEEKQVEQQQRLQQQQQEEPPHQTVTIGADKGGVRSMFARETTSEVGLRKATNYEPLVGRKAEEAGIHFGEWFAFPGVVQPSSVIPLCIPLPNPPLPLEQCGELSRAEINEMEQRRFAQWIAAVDNTSRAVGEVNLFERNLEVWRQLWRTVERSDVVVLVADARYPIFHLPVSAVHFISTVSQKPLIIVLNKVDLVPRDVLDAWKAFLRVYLAEFGEVPLLEFSCTPNRKTVTREAADVAARMPKRKIKAKEQYDFHVDGRKDSEGGDHEDQNATANFKGMEKLRAEELSDRVDHEERTVVAEYIRVILKTCRALAEGAAAPKGRDSTAPVVTIGIVGQTNVGKSSLLNCLIGHKSVSVSATAGHTKHLQTIPLESEGCVLVDCPGLCFPVIGIPRPLQAVMGTHQIAQTRDPESGVAYLAHRLPIERIYRLQKPFDDDHTTWSPFEICEAYAAKKGFHIRGKSKFDVHRAAIALLGEAYEGRLVLFFRPPNSSGTSSVSAASTYLVDLQLPTKEEAVEEETAE